MKLQDAFLSYQLTNDQSELINQLEFFLHDKNQRCFLLKGYAGTGKTFITKGLTEYFKEMKRDYILAAPTGKAAKVIKEKTGSDAYTIHKTIYSNTDIKEYKDGIINGTETYKFYFSLNNNEQSARAVYIIDEASMIADVYQESEFFRFGTGFVLRDLMKYINIDNNDHDKKIIFIGDNAQLPPVGMNFSPALSEEYLWKNYQLRVGSYELTQVVRQDAGSGVLENAFMMRNALKENTFNKLDFNMDFFDILHVDHSDLLNQYLVSCNNKINGESIIIAYSNASVSEYNKRIRQHFFPNQEMLVSGDKVMVVCNTIQEEHLLFNGDFGLVKKVAVDSESRHILIKRKNELTSKVEEIKIQLVFRDIELGFRSSDNGVKYINCKVIENILYSDKPSLSSDEQKALYIYFCIRNPGLKSGSKEFKDTLKSDKYFNAMKIKFGYAITCHKAQGSEWNNVFVNCKAHMGSLNSSYFRWLYTAITRTSKKLFTLDEPHIKLGSSMKAVEQEYSGVQIPNNSIVNKSTINDLDSPLFGINPNDVFLVSLLRKVLDVIKIEDIEIVDIQHNKYQEAYYFSDSIDTVRFNIIYNGKMEISNIISQNKGDLSYKLDELLSCVLHVRFIEKPESISKKNIGFQFSETFLEEFYEQVSIICKSRSIDVNKITSHEWMERYMFSQGDEIASIDFHYNGKKQFTKYHECRKESTSQKLINTLKEVLLMELIL